MITPMTRGVATHGEAIRPVAPRKNGSYHRLKDINQQETKPQNPKRPVAKPYTNRIQFYEYDPKIASNDANSGR